MKEKTFYKALLELSSDPDKAKRSLLDKRLTAIEKQIIDGYLKIRNNQNYEVIESMQKNITSDSMFVESQRLLLIGCASNNLSQFAQAEKYLFNAIEILKKMETPYFHFFAYFNLFWIKSNLNETQQMEKILNEMQKIPVANEHQRLRFLRCQFSFYHKTQDFQNATRVLNEIEPIRSSLSESDIISYLIEKFMFYIQMDDFTHCYDILADMKNYRKFHLSENYKFMKKLMDHLTKESPIYAYAQDFDKVPVLHHQIKFIQSLEENKLDDAKTHWASLQTISPSTYKENYNYNGSKCLFSLCLEKHRHQLVIPKKLEIAENLPKIEALISLLSKSNIPLAAGLIFETIWGRTIEDKEDLMKLTRMVSRAKSEKGVDIVFRKGTYQIKKSAAEKAS